jgi:pSer/pThr/pTyr-binding forkhead associated (FHA) protein
MPNDEIRISLMSGPQDGFQHRFPMPRGGKEVVLSIGRNEDSDIPLAYDSQVSRAHAQLICAVNDDTMLEAGQHQRLTIDLVDVGSRNGTLIRDRRLFGERVEIEPGELFRVGRTWLRIDP